MKTNKTPNAVKTAEKQTWVQIATFNVAATKHNTLRTRIFTKTNLDGFADVIEVHEDNAGIAAQWFVEYHEVSATGVVVNYLWVGHVKNTAYAVSSAAQQVANFNRKARS